MMATNLLILPFALKIDSMVPLRGDSDQSVVLIVRVVHDNQKKPLTAA